MSKRIKRKSHLSQSYPKPEKTTDFSLYIHTPFCVRRCSYCAFYSIADADSAQIAAYPDLIIQELRLRSADWLGRKLISVYFGGGTPSLLDPDQVHGILKTVFRFFEPATDIEITLEANPGTLDRAKLDGFREAGVNRVSLGVQALDDRRLRFLDRIHTVAEAEAALQLLKEPRSVRISVDLMLGTPFETKNSWDRELDRLFAFQPEAISLYTLTLEEGTRLASRAAQGDRVRLSAEATVELLLHVARRLRRNGYRHYEVSNWALLGSECRHNLHYWRRGCYLGLGPSAHSFDGVTRRWNSSDLTAYQGAVSNAAEPPANEEHLSEEDSRVEWVYLSLRQEHGLDLDEYHDGYGPVPAEWMAILQKLEEAGLGSFSGNTFRPNDRGLLLADEIAARLLAVKK